MQAFGYYLKTALGDQGLNGLSDASIGIDSGAVRWTYTKKGTYEGAYPKPVQAGQTVTTTGWAGNADLTIG